MFKSFFKKTTIFKVNGKRIDTDTPAGKAALEKFDKDMDEFSERMDKSFSQMDDAFSTLTDTIEQVDPRDAKIQMLREGLTELFNLCVEGINVQWLAKEYQRSGKRKIIPSIESHLDFEKRFYKATDALFGKES